MIRSVSIAPANSLVVVAGGPEADCPEQFPPGKGIAATPSCIAVICLPEVDGPTNITLGCGLKGDGAPEYSGHIDTPKHKVAVWTVEWEALLEVRVTTSRTKIRVWRNHPRWPTEVLIAVGE